MTLHAVPGTGRRGLLLPLAVAACTRPEPPAPSRPLSFSHLTPLLLNVATLDVAPGGPVPPPGDLGAGLDPPPAEAVRRMGRERLSAVGTSSQAVFAVTVASLARDGVGMACLVGCGLEILAPDGSRAGFVRAEARAAAVGPEASRPQAADLLLRRAMDDLNVEFEFHLRRNLRGWLVAGVPEVGGVTREDLPRDGAVPEAIARPDDRS